MNRFRSSRILPIVLLASAAVFVGSAADQNGGATPLAAAGAYAVTFHVNTPTTVPDGATIACKARVTPNISVIEHLMRRKEAVAESSTGYARVANSSANCTVATPFAFNVADRDAGAALSYEIDAYTSAGPVFARTQQGIAVAYPRAGATANVPLDVNF
jgi:hypothetical protein